MSLLSSAVSILLAEKASNLRRAFIALSRDELHEWLARRRDQPHHKMSMEWKTIDRYLSTPQLSSDLVRLACAALSADELAEWICGRVASRREKTC